MKSVILKKWIKKHSKNLIYQYGLEDWDIYFKCSLDSSGERGVSNISWDIKEAHIVLYNKNHENILDLENTVRHELCHLVISPYEHTTRLEKNKVLNALFKQTINNVAEMAVTNLLKMSKRHRGIK